MNILLLYTRGQVFYQTRLVVVAPYLVGHLTGPSRQPDGDTCMASLEFGKPKRYLNSAN